MRVRIEAAVVMFVAALVLGTVVYFIERTFIKLTPAFIPMFVAIATVTGFVAPRYANSLRALLLPKRGSDSKK